MYFLSSNIGSYLRTHGELGFHAVAGDCFLEKGDFVFHGTVLLQVALVPQMMLRVMMEKIIVTMMTQQHRSTILYAFALLRVAASVAALPSLIACVGCRMALFITKRTKSEMDCFLKPLI